MMGVTDYVDVSLLEKRFKREHFDLREFVSPNTLSVKELAEKLDKDPIKCIQWVIEQVNYPWSQRWPAWTMYLSDLHLLFRHPLSPKLSINALDFWKFPYETIRDLKGDCEDGAFLCASLLRACGEDAWAVIGTVKVQGQEGGHGWCEWDGKVIETTLDTMPDYFPLTDDVYEVIYFPKIKVNEDEVTEILRQKRRARKVKSAKQIKNASCFKCKRLKKPKKLHAVLRELK